MSQDFLAISKQDMLERGWQQLDFLFISGDAYVDHPSFATAVIGRVLESKGYKVGVICQPDWKNVNDFKLLGKPRLGVLICSGNLDSMLNKYTAAKKERSVDAYSSGGQNNRRPDRATIVYCNRIREVWKNIPLIIGGIEPSLRRFSHYDYWSDSLRRSILVDSKANILIYGMGERQIAEIADCLAGGMLVKEIKHVDGTAFMQTDAFTGDCVQLPSHEKILSNKENFATAFKLQYQEQDPIRGKTVVQRVGDNFVIQRKPAMPLTQSEIDAIYDLPYQRKYHPSYEAYGGVPAIAEVQCSIISQRGCFGSCSFCAIHFHQGRMIQARSHQSILQEAEYITKLPEFKGYINDVGGPTANFRKPSCQKQFSEGVCSDKQCLFPKPCPNLDVDHEDYMLLLQKLRSLKGIKKVFIRSGIRYDYVLEDKKNDFLQILCAHHVSGQLKVAPEHVSKKVLKYMHKPGKNKYLEFVDKYRKTNNELDKKQYLVPYYISSHPGCTLDDAIELAEFIRDTGHFPEQVQDFIPTPGSAATAMYYSGVDPFTGKNVYVTRHPYEKAMQRALLQYKNPKNYELVLAALQKAKRMDLIGFEKKCLIKPPKWDKKAISSKKKRKIY